MGSLLFWNFVSVNGVDEYLTSLNLLLTNIGLVIADAVYNPVHSYSKSKWL